jgi:hypothetical protein
MFELVRRKRDDLEPRGEEPSFFVALAVGLVYVFRTAAGARIMRELESAVRRYAADPAALWRLVQAHEREQRRQIIDTTVVTRET